MRAMGYICGILAVALVFASDGCRKRPTQGGATLWNVVWTGDTKRLKVLLAEGANVNVADSDGKMPLHVAVSRDNQEWVQLFVEHGADLKATDKDGQTPVSLAVDEGHQRIVEILVAAGSPVTIHVAAYLGDLQQIQKFLQTGVDVNARTKKGRTPLHLAARMGYTRIVSTLLDHGADPYAKAPPFDETPLHEAAMYGHVDVVEDLLAHGVDINVQDGVGGETALHDATYAGQTPVVEFLLSKGADVNIKNRREETPLRSVFGRIVVRPMIDLDAPLRTRLGEIGRLLLAKGAQLKGADENEDGELLLRFAVQYGLRDLTHTMLAKGVSPDGVPRSEVFYIPLLDAISREHKDIVALLITSGADVNIYDQVGDTPLHLAARKNDVDLAGNLLAKGAKINAGNQVGVTPLHEAASASYKDMVEFLASHGAELNVPDAKGNAPLHYAARGDKDVVGLLLAKGASVNVKNHDGDTPLHDAALRGNKKSVEVLLTHGSDSRAKDMAGHTPLDKAVKTGRNDVADLLRKYVPRKK